jgi:hypothetical protein
MITASSLPRAFRCAGSFALPQASLDSPDAAAGVDRHAEREAAINAGDLDGIPGRVRALIPADVTSVRAEVALALHLGTGRGREIGSSLDRAYVTEPGELAGTCDFVALAPGRALILDWKSSTDVGAPDKHEQSMFYAAALARAHRLDEVTLAIYYELTGQLEHVTVDAIELDAFVARLRDVVDEIARQAAHVRAGRMPDVAEGRHCTHCPATHACPARTALLRRLVSGQEADELELMMPLDGVTARAAYERLLAGKSLLRRVERALHAFADKQPIDLGEGRYFGKFTKRGNETIDGDEAYNVILQLHGHAVADAAVERRATKTRIRAALKAAVPPGAASAAERAVLAAIRERGGSVREEKESVGEYHVRDLLIAEEEST